MVKAKAGAAGGRVPVRDAAGEQVRVGEEAAAPSLAPVPSEIASVQNADTKSRT